MAIHVVSIWVYSFCPIDLTPIISEFFARCRSSNLRIEHSVQLAHYDDIAPETKNKIQRMTVVHKSVGQEKRDLGVNLKNVAYLTVESQQADSFHAPVHDLRTMRHTSEIAANMGASFIPIVLHYNSIDTFMKQGRAEGVDMSSILRKGFVEDVRGKPPQLLAKMIFDHIAYNQ